MVSGSRTDSESPVLSAQMRNTIQSIKEIATNHSDAEIYIALKETNMDPNETAQKLLFQDPFHEVKSKRDKKKESMGYKVSADPRKQPENAAQTMKYNKYPDRNADNAGQSMKYNKYPDRNADNAGQETKYNKFPDRNAENANQGAKYSKFPDRGAEHAGRGIKSNKFPDRPAESGGRGMKYNAFPDRNARRGSYTRNSVPDAGVVREFRVVRDNRLNQNTNGEVKTALSQTPSKEEVVLNPSEKGSTSTSVDSKPLGGHRFQPSNGSNESQPRHAREASSSGTNRKEVLEEKRATVPSSVSRVQAVKPNNSQSNPAMSASSNSVVGLYSSSTDPVHVPSPDSRSSAGVVGVRRQPSENTNKRLSSPSSSFSNSVGGRDSTTESFRPFTAISKTDRDTHAESVIPSMTSRLPTNNNQYNSRLHQVAGHQKALQPNKEWKPKSSQKSSAVNPGPGVIGTPTKTTSPPVENCKVLDSEAAKLQDKTSRANIHESQNVIIAQHIRVPETDRCRLTFGSFGTEFDNSQNYVSVGATDESVGESAASLSVSAPESTTDDGSGSKQADFVEEDQVRNSGSDSSLSGAASEHHLVDKNESSSPQSMENYADIGLVRDNSPSYAPSVSQQQQDPPVLPSFSAYDPQTGYEMPYFRSTMDESLRGQSFSSPQEVLNLHTATSTMTMVQQQQHPQQMGQMYPQVHVSHYANLMPYRQFLSPVYVPPMAMPGYSSNPAYPHPSNGNNYLLMPGGGSQFSAGLKYGIQPYKPVPAGSPTGFGNFPSPSGYAINAPGVVGSATGLEDSSRIKYKDGNLYIPNPQAETSEMWIQNPRDIPGQYYNIPGQTPQAAYMPSHTGHGSFNPAVAAAQTSHMQFQGMYHHPQQPGAMGNPHAHLGPVMGGNVGGAGSAPGAQVGAYQQQPQLGHLNWTTNF